MTYLALPESPVWLLSRDRVERAEASLQRLGVANHGRLLQQMMATIQHERQDPTASKQGEGAATYREAFRGRVNARRSGIIILLNVLQNLVGMAILSNGAYFLLMAGMSAKYSLMVNLIGVVSNMVANAISWYTVSRYGRRTMILISIALDVTVWFSMGIAGCFSSSAASW